MGKASALICAVLVTGSMVGCSAGSTPSPASSSPAAAPVTSTTPAPNSKEALETRAHQLDLLASQGDAEPAYAYYSQRCKNIIGNLDAYKMFLTEWRKGRNPQYGGVTVKVNGSSAQVVSVDNDPNAPASSMQPRTWTFIDGQWQFDNC